MSKVLLETDASNNAQNYYVYGLDLISRIDNSNNTHYYHDDFRGSVIALTDENETITHKYQYADFGAITQIEEANHNPYRYVGKHGIQFEENGLYFMRARYYDAHTGRFLTEDPIWATNLYPYAGNNPVMNIDPTGEFPIDGELFLETLQETISDTNVWKDAGHNVLDGIGLVPVVGEAADGVNGLFYLLEGDDLNAGLSFGAMIPFAGWGSTSLKFGKKFTNKGVSFIDDIAEGGISRIQNAANGINQPIHLVGSRAKGTSGLNSDFDYVIEGITGRNWNKIKNSLPGSKIINENIPRRIDLFRGKLDSSKPHITIYPK